MPNIAFTTKGFLTRLEEKLKNLSHTESIFLAALFIAVWATYYWLTEMPVALKHDMTEAYAWGLEFKLGYNEHPPFWAWVCGLWFSIFPSNLFCFALLSATNSAIGLWGIWRLTAKLVRDPTQRLIARLLPVLTPLYTFYAFKFDANIIFLSLWPWTLLFFFSSSEEKNKRATILLGIMSGLTLLSKYYAILPLAGCFLAATCTPNGRRWLRSFAPWQSGGIAFLVCLPHVFWLYRYKAPPLVYLNNKLGLAWHVVLAAAGKADGSLLGMLGGVIGLLSFVALIYRGKKQLQKPISSTYTLWAAVITLTPLCLTLFFGLGMKLILMAEMMIGVIPLLPLLIYQLYGKYCPSQPLARITLALVLTVNAVSLLAAPLYTFWRVEFTKSWQKQLPIQEVVQESTRLWQEHTHAKLVYVSGSTWYVNATSFYNAAHPYSFVTTNIAPSLWVPAEKLHRYGLLSICPLTQADAGCVELAMHYATDKTVQLPLSAAHKFAGRTAKPQNYVIIITPPSP